MEKEYYDVVLWDTWSGNCIRRYHDKEPEFNMRDETPSPLRVGTVLLCDDNAVGIVLPDRKNKDGLDIYSGSVAVKVLYSYLVEKYKKEVSNFAVWSTRSCEVLKGEMATTAKEEPKMFIKALLESKAKAKDEEMKRNPLRTPLPSTPPVQPLPEPKPVGRTAVKRTPVAAKPEPTPVTRTPVKRTPIQVKEDKVDPIEEMRRKLSKI